jgi:hypothetical protein
MREVEANRSPQTGGQRHRGPTPPRETSKPCPTGPARHQKLLSPFRQNATASRSLALPRGATPANRRRSRATRTLGRWEHRSSTSTLRAILRSSATQASQPRPGATRTIRRRASPQSSRSPSDPRNSGSSYCSPWAGAECRPGRATSLAQVSRSRRVPGQRHRREASEPWCR